MNSKTIGLGMAGVGLALALVSIFADTLGIGGDPTAFGWKQVIGTSVGLALVLGGAVSQAVSPKE